MFVDFLDKESYQAQFKFNASELCFIGVVFSRKIRVILFTHDIFTMFEVKAKICADQQIELTNTRVQKEPTVMKNYYILLVHRHVVRAEAAGFSERPSSSEFRRFSWIYVL